MEVVPTSISGEVDISVASGCQLLWHMSSQLGSKRSLKGLMSHELTVYLSVSDLFLTQWIMSWIKYYQRMYTR